MGLSTNCPHWAGGSLGSLSGISCCFSPEVTYSQAQGQSKWPGSPMMGLGEGGGLASREGGEVGVTEP